MVETELTPKPAKPMRLDLALVERGLCESREKAKRAVMAGQARVNGQRAAKSSDKVKPSAELTLAVTDKFVSRGGHKLEHALETFSVEVAGLRAVDLGASTGGFTDCLLQHGAAMVAAVDVGQGQLAWALRNDERVHVMERTNARYLKPASFPQPFEPFNLAVVDCSFISLRQILPATVDLLPPGGLDAESLERVLEFVAAPAHELVRCRECHLIAWFYLVASLGCSLAVDQRLPGHHGTLGLLAALAQPALDQCQVQPCQLCRLGRQLILLHDGGTGCSRASFSQNVRHAARSEPTGRDDPCRN